MGPGRFCCCFNCSELEDDVEFAGFCGCSNCSEPDGSVRPGGFCCCSNCSPEGGVGPAGVGAGCRAWRRCKS